MNFQKLLQSVDLASLKRMPTSLFSLGIVRVSGFGFLSLLVSGLAMAQPVIVDSFDTAHVTNADSVNPTVTAQISGPGILGTQRDIRVEFLAGGSGQQTTSNAGAGTLGHGETDNSTGRTIITWDGVDGSAFGAVLDGNNDVIGGGIDTDGLGGIDIEGNCVSPSPGFYIGGSPSDNGNDYSVTINVYTSDTQWSTLSRTKSPGGGASSLLAFPFTEFSPRGTGAGGSGAAFDSVGAIELIIDVTGVGTDLSVFTPLAGCEYDFGDAPQFQAGVSLARYTTTINFKQDLIGVTGQANNVQRGPHALIGGPWMPQYSLSLGNAGTNDTDGETNGQPSVGADGDDNLTQNDEQGVFLPVMPLGDTAIDPELGPVSCDGLEMGPSEYCAAVRVANPTSVDAQLFGFVDFDGDTIFEVNGCTGTDGVVDDASLGTQGCERSSSEVRIGDTGLGDFGGSCSASSLTSGQTIGGATFTTGNIPANCEGIVILVWDLSSTGLVTANTTYSRFRITTDRNRGNYFNDSPGPQPFGFQGDGEIEDHILEAGTLPVSISSFESNQSRSGLRVAWSTVSETQNAGFYVWGDTGSEFRLLTSQMVPSNSSDISRQQDYSVDIPSRLAQGVESLVVSAIDINGKEEMYGLFTLGRNYGRDSASSPIDWAGIESSIAGRLSSRGFSRDGNTWRSPASGFVVAADFKVSAEGMQRITYQDLLDAGLDLAGVYPNQIAVTVDGRPVARHIHRFDDGGLNPIRGSKNNDSRGGFFGSSHVIDFWGEKPSLPDALYVSEYSYRVSVDPSRVVISNHASRVGFMQQTPEHQVSVVHDDANRYSMTSVLDDPWYTARLRANHVTSSYQATLGVAQDLSADKPSYIEVIVAGTTDFPESPDHHVEVHVNGQFVESIMFDGRVRQTIAAELPAGLINPGSNSVEVRLPGGTEAAADIVYLDSIKLTYSAALMAESNRLLITDVEPDRAFTVRGMTTNNSVAFAWDGSELTQLPTSIAGRGMVAVTPERGDGYSFWVSSPEAFHRPQFAGSAGTNALVDHSADFLIIAHPAFMPATSWEPHPLNDFINHRTSEGWKVALIDVSEVQSQYSGGMPLPQAVQRFLADANNVMRYEHVLLVGGDSYDYNDHLGLGSLSFIPTMYSRTSEIPHSPSDALLADLDNDGVADKSIGRWPVRTLGDLQSIVAKSIDWDYTSSGLESAVWVADSDQPSERSFRSQANRMIDSLETAGWAPASIDRLYFDDVGAGIDAGDYLRNQFFAALEQGRSLTGFVGHGAPSMWTFQGLLTPNDIADLNNDGMPTLIGTMTCYTSYFVSPYGETVAHRWMNGYRVDESGNQIAGVPNGAVAIHGAATLSNYNQNEIFAQQVQDYLLSGLTLGQAVERSRRFAQERGMTDLVLNWTLLGDPTLRLHQNQRSRKK